MIVYCAGTRFFDKKADAEKHRIQLGLPPKETLTFRIENREQLAEFLNALCNPPQQTIPGMPTVTPPPDDAWIPSFIKEDWKRRREGR